jgi:hypothetical protein
MEPRGIFFAHEDRLRLEVWEEEVLEASLASSFATEVSPPDLNGLAGFSAGDDFLDDSDGEGVTEDLD